MQPTNNINGLDEMLKQAFLDLDLSKAGDSKLMDEVAAQVMNKDWPLVNGRSNPWKNNPAAVVPNTWIWILSGVVMLTGLTITVLLLGSSRQSTYVAETNPQANTSTSTIVTPENKIPDEEATNKVPEPQATAVSKHVTQKPTPVVAFNAANNTSADPNIVPATTPVNTTTENTTTASKQPEPLSNISPEQNKNVKPIVLSNEELEKHRKELKTLDETFVAMKMSDYSLINLDKDATTAKGNFLLKKTEVTNKEYKLFLTDLLVNGRAKEYEMAKPKPDNIWKDAKDKNNKAFLEMYFRKAKFENNPVICVSTDAMELYCEWLQARMEAYFKRGNENAKVTVRLPRVEEWKYVASEGNKHHVYGTANGKLKDNFLGLGQHWNANFIETQEKFVAVGDSLIVVEKDTKLPVTHKVNHNGFIGPARAYPASVYDVFNMSGNVSEIVSYQDKKGVQKYRSIGGNWNSTGDYLKINAPDEFNGNTQPSPYIGFRPVIVIEK